MAAFAQRLKELELALTEVRRHPKAYAWLKQEVRNGQSFFGRKAKFPSWSAVIAQSTNPDLNSSAGAALVRLGTALRDVQLGKVPIAVEIAGLGATNAGRLFFIEGEVIKVILD